MRQHYEQYTKEHQEVWRTLFTRQYGNLKDKAVAEYIGCLDVLRPVFNEAYIPHFDLLNERLYALTGWNIIVVPGLIPAADFLSYLSERKFCSSVWLRSLEQLDYLEEPDMFHDLFGHVPLLVDRTYADFMQRLGALGKRYEQDEEAIQMLERFYWYTVEFGVVKKDNAIHIYGAGIISSFQETNSIYDRGMDIREYNLEELLSSDFTKSTLQTKYYALADSMSECMMS